MSTTRFAASMGVQDNLSTYLFAVAMAALAVCFMAAEDLGPLVASSLGLTGRMWYDIFSATWEAGLAIGVIGVMLLLSGRAKTKKARKKIDSWDYEAKPVKVQDHQSKRGKKPVQCPAPKQQTGALQKAASAEVSKQEGKARLSETLYSFIKTGDLHRASRTLLQLEAEYGDVCLSQYTCVITLCSKSSDADAARWWLQRVKETGRVPNLVCYNSVLNAFAKQGHMNRALEIVEEMREAGVEYDTVTYNTIIDAWARADDALNAQLWMKRMLAANVMPSVVSFASVMRACAKAGLTEELAHWLQQAEKLGIELNIICFSAIINSFAKNDDFDTAYVWLVRMIERGLAPTAPCFTGVLYGFVNKGDMDSTGKVIETLKAANVELGAAVFSAAVCAAANSGLHKQAEDWAADIVASGNQLTRSAESSLMASNLIVPSRSAAKPAEATVEEQRAGEFVSKSAARRALTGRKFIGTIKDFIASKFGYIECDEVFAVYQRDVFLCSQQNPLQLGKGQKVSFTLQLDRQRGLPRAVDLSVYHPKDAYPSATSDGGLLK